VSLVSLADMKLALGISGTSEDSYLQRELDFMTAIVESYCARSFEFQADVVESFYDLEECHLYLNRYPVSDIESIDVDGTLLDLTTIRKEPTAGRIYTPSILNAQKVDVTYDGGYVIIPMDIQRVVIDLVSSRYANRDSTQDPTRRIRSESVPDVANFIYERSLAFDKEPLLGPYIFILDRYRSVNAFGV
jgi:hypothetical protein